MWVVTQSLWDQLKGELPGSVPLAEHELTTALGGDNGSGLEVPLEAGMECAVAPGSEDETRMP